jgi:hypothetical protein
MSNYFPVTGPYQGPGRHQSYGVRSSGRMHSGLDFTPPIRLQDHANEFGILAYRGRTGRRAAKALVSDARRTVLDRRPRRTILLRATRSRIQERS